MSRTLERKGKHPPPASAPIAPGTHLQSEAEQVMVLMALVSQGAQAPDVLQACEELAISPVLVRKTIDGLEQNLRVLRSVFDRLAGESEDEDED